MPWKGGNLLTKLKQKYSKLQEAYLETIYRLAITAEIFDENTYVHILRISLFSEKFAELCGEDEKFCNNIKFASMMHDVGKIGIPIELLQKNGKLTFGEFEIIKQHPKIGYRILKDSGNELLKMVKEISSFHHEKWNGQGYTEKLKGKNIPKSARIVAIVDVFDALMSKRPYKPPFSPEKVKLIFAEDKCKHFDPELLNIFMINFDIFLDIYKKYLI